MDHHAPGLILNLADANGELTFSGLRLTQFRFGIFHSDEIKHQITHALSRRRTEGSDGTTLEDAYHVCLSLD